MKKIILFVILFFSPNLKAEVVDLMDKVDSIECSASYNSSDRQYFYLTIGPNQPGAPHRRLTFVHEWVESSIHKKRPYPILSLAYDKDLRIFLMTVNTQQGVGKVSFAQQKGGIFNDPSSPTQYKLDYCEIRSRL